MERDYNIEYLKKYYNGNLEDAIKRLDNNEAVQYIVGNVNFYGYELDVNKNVLIPRRETEELVYEVINRSKNFNNPVIIDVGTGSGAIAITLSKELKSHVYASDISPDALIVAKKNCTKTKADITFYEGDMLKPYIDNNIKVDIIVSNPPYIKLDEEIEDVVKNNEPHLALYAQDNGLEYYKKILSTAKEILNDKFLIAFEIGNTQANDIKNIVKKYFKDVKVEVKKDLSDNDRMFFVYNY
ncbi:MAG: peptide chain release factor N(5)-glutamine methyltransferase [Tenericutes bacterium]|nr:peptide chain release factor N(5)-glutamine methyltransferase [Mycoplasmatota bacterium]